MKSIVKIGLVGLGHFANAVLGFAYLATLGRALSLDDFGKYALLSTILLGMAKLTDFGTNNLYVAKSITQDEDDLYNSFISSKTLLFFIGLPVSIIILQLVGLLTWPILLIYVLSYIAYTFSLGFYSLFQKIEKYAHLVVLNTIPAVIKGIAAVLIFLSLIHPTVVTAFGIFGLSIIPSLVLGFWLPKHFFKPKIDLSSVKKFFRQAFPAGVAQMTGEGWSALSTAIAKFARGFTETGIYGLAEKMSTVYQIVSFSIITVLLPQNAKRKKAKQGYDFKETLLLSLLIFLAGGVAAVLSKFFILYFFGDKFVESIGLVYILIFAYGITAIHTFLENYFYVEQKTSALMKVSLTRLAVFLISAAFLVTTYGLTGLAWAQMVASTAALVVTVRFILI